MVAFLLAPKLLDAACIELLAIEKIYLACASAHIMFRKIYSPCSDRRYP